MRHRNRGIALATALTFTALLTFTSVSQARYDEDVMVWAQGDASGFHLFTGVASERWAWRPLATLKPLETAGEPWIGYHCLTGDGRQVVATVAPRSAANSPTARDRGAFAYAVDVRTGKVRPLASGIALKYHTPGCGLGARATLSRSLGRDQARTQLLLVDARRGKVLRTATVRGQVTSAVPVGRQIWAARGSSIVRVDRRGTRRIVRTAGQPFNLRPSRPGVDFLMTRASSRVQVRSLARGKVRRLATGKLGATQLYLGRGGRSVVVGARTRARGTARALRFAKAPRGGDVRGASLGGRVVLSQRLRRGGSTAPPAIADGVGRVQPRLSRARGTRTRSVAIGDARRKAYTRRPAFVGLPQARKSGFTTPKCAVPRNDLRRQVPQPNAPQVNWAIQQATRNLLKGSVLTRPANYANMNLVAYQPSNDFARGALSGGGSTPVPPAVISAVYAQESAWRHASFRALPGVSGNPLVSDYYGAGGTLDRIEYNDADCGYGVSQVTDPMTAAATAYSANGKTKVAVDYAENVAAGIQFLVDKWNQLAAAGVTLNNGNPALVENWYFAVWAYNTGFHPPSAGTPWGLGWTNNPQNSDYPPDRAPFLRETYADAEHPADWPYQERIFGWMETPLVDYKGNAAYTAVGPLEPPNFSRFCTASNECSPSYHNPSNPSLDYCMRADRKCWWREPVTWLDCSMQCHDSPFSVSTTATEPASDNNYAPACSSTLAAAAIIVDEQPNNLNVEGCGATGWTSQGTFSVTHGTAASGAPLAVIDWHQLGTGFGGHIWFTKNQPASDTAHINTGTWTPPALNGIYNIKAHIPPSGASTNYARYRIHRGDGTVSERTISQHLHENRWVSLGNFTLQAGAKVVLDNATGEADESANVAFDALAFTQVVGTPVRRTIESAGIFDENQSLDNSPPWPSGYLIDPWNSMQNLYNWATDKGGSVESYPTCPGSTRNVQCVGPATDAAATTWMNRVRTAGASHQVPQPADTMPKWLGFPNPDPPATLPAGYLDDLEHHKIRARLKVEFLAAGGQVDPGSVTAEFMAASGDTHTPDVILDFMRAVNTDYGVPLPNIAYDAVDLNSYTHGFTHVDPLVTGRMPGRSYRWKTSVPVLTNNGTCVRVRTISGGSKGDKPMIKNAAVRASVDTWYNRVQDLDDQGRAPEAVGRLARAIHDEFFRLGSAASPHSPFQFAPAIWMQQDVKVCADGTVRPGGAQLAYSGYMPDLYLWVEGQRVGLDALPTAGPAQVGDYPSFVSAPQYLYPLGDGDPWADCHTDPAHPDFRGLRDGIPWKLQFDTDKDESPDYVRLCDEPVSALDPPHDG
jgi:hypothetical protein